MKKQKIERLTQLNFTTNYKATVIKTVSCQCKNKQIMETEERPE